jgi:transcriptional regulator with XRE-family HTH domain
MKRTHDAAAEVVRARLRMAYVAGLARVREGESMGGSGSGRRPDWPRRRRVLALRARGLTFAEIGRRVGITREAARQLVHKAAGPHPCACCAAPLPLGSRGGHCLACAVADPFRPWAERLRALRRAAGLTQTELAARAGVSASTLFNYERGRGRPRPSRLTGLAGVLGPGLLGPHDGGPGPTA